MLNGKSLNFKSNNIGGESSSTSGGGGGGGRGELDYATTDGYNNKEIFNVSLAT